MSSGAAYDRATLCYVQLADKKRKRTATVKLSVLSSPIPSVMAIDLPDAAAVDLKGIAAALQVCA